MYCIKEHRTDPYFNLAAEEYLMKQSGEEFFLLYRNEPSVVVGKHQNALAEIDLLFAREKAIKVARRISGGGTVFHDLGNLNFSFITNGEAGKMVNYRRYATPIVEALKIMGVETTFSQRDDLLLGGMKISGNASHIFKQRALHHGTLLFSSHLENLTGALKTDPERFSDKAVKSVRSGVTNICDQMEQKIDILEFRDHIMEHMISRWPDSRIYTYSEEDEQAIERLRDEKFSTWEWNFGYSPKYAFKKTVTTQKGKLSVEMQVVGGMISEIFLQSDFLKRSDVTAIEKQLMGVRHDPAFISERIREEPLVHSLPGLSEGELLKLFL